MDQKLRLATLLGIDWAGTILLVIGAAAEFGDIDFWPSAWQFPADNYVLMGMGIVLMIPYFRHVLSRGRQVQKGR